MRRIFFLCAFVLFGGLSNPVRNDRPNVLIIISDDVGLDSWERAGIGNSFASTPNLDTLADQGLTFRNAWTTPTCSPTRAALLSGLIGSKNGVLEVGDQLDPSFETLFEAVDRHTGGEYAIGAFGKWHIGPNRDLDNPNEQGAHHFHGYMGGAPSDYSNWDQVINGSSSETTTYLTTDITSAAIDWKQQQTGPWMIWMAHAAAHTPFHAPPDSLHTRTSLASDRDQYLAMIEALDAETGRLVDSLSPAERENTIIFYVGDNGTPVGVLEGYPNRRGKGTLYQGGVNVPFIVSGFGVTRSGEIDQALVHTMDIHATVLDLLGVELNGGVNNSFSLEERLLDASGRSRPYLLTETGNGADYQVAIRDDQYKVIRQSSGETTFFDLLDDPFERTDLASMTLSADLQSRLDQLVAEADVQVNGWSCNDGIQNGDEDSMTCAVETRTEEGLPGSGFELGSVYPNPFVDQLTIESESSMPISRVTMFTLTGQRVQSWEAFSPEQTMQLHVSSLSAGMYVLRIESHLGGQGSVPAVETRLVTKR